MHGSVQIIAPGGLFVAPGVLFSIASRTSTHSDKATERINHILAPKYPLYCSPVIDNISAMQDELSIC